MQAHAPSCAALDALSSPQHLARRARAAKRAGMSPRICFTGIFYGKSRSANWIADYFCSMELAALRYTDHEETNTYIKLFGGSRAFKANHLKQMRRKMHA